MKSACLKLKEELGEAGVVSLIVVERLARLNLKYTVETMRNSKFCAMARNVAKLM